MKAINPTRAIVSTTQVYQMLQNPKKFIEIRRNCSLVACPFTRPLAGPRRETVCFAKLSDFSYFMPCIMSCRVVQ